MIWINGEPETHLAANDRAVQFGDGCFTTARLINGKVVALEQHIERLSQACQRLQIAHVDWRALSREMIAIGYGQDEGVLKVILSRGAGGRGYSAKGCGQPTRILSVSPYPAHYHQLRQRGARLALSTVRLSRNPLLAGIKHLNRLEQVLIRTELEQTGADEALVLDTEGMLVECCAANLFWRRGEKVFTPDLSHAGVNGIQRQHVIRVLRGQGITVEEVRTPPEILASVDEVVITNALMPVLPVYQIENWRWNSRQLFELISHHDNQHG